MTIQRFQRTTPGPCGQASGEACAAQFTEKGGSGLRKGGPEESALRCEECRVQYLCRSFRIRSVDDECNVDLRRSERDHADRDVVFLQRAEDRRQRPPRAPEVLADDAEDRFVLRDLYLRDLAQLVWK